MSNNKKKLSPEQRETLLSILKIRFEKNKSRHKDIEWAKVQMRLEAHPEKLWSLHGPGRIRIKKRTSTRK